MTHPIKSHMPTIFIPVSDLKRSTEWYADLLEQPIVAKQSGGQIYYFNFDGTDIILDSNIWGFPPTIMFNTDDIDAAYSYCQAHPHQFLSEVFRFHNVSFFNINANMLCQSHEAPSTGISMPFHPLLQRISRVFVHADQLPDSIAWYESFLQRKIEADPWLNGLSSIRMERGAHLLFDDNRLSQTPRVFFDRLQLDLRVNPVIIIETPNIEAAYDYVHSKGANIIQGIETRLDVACFQFQDPDGNGLMVCESK